MEQREDPYHPIITKQSNCLTDRSATEVKTNRLLAELNIKKFKHLIDNIEEVPAEKELTGIIVLYIFCSSLQMKQKKLRKKLKIL